MAQEDHELDYREYPEEVQEVESSAVTCKSVGCIAEFICELDDMPVKVYEEGNLCDVELEVIDGVLVIGASLSPKNDGSAIAHVLAMEIKKIAENDDFLTGDEWTRIKSLAYQILST
jgi:hypothetical protein